MSCRPDSTRRVPGRRRRRLAFTLLALAVAARLPAEERVPAGLDPAKRLTQYVLESWTADEGLPSSRVLDITQTADGFLWLATYNGLVRFDGARFHRFHDGNSPAFTTNEIYALAARPGGGLWVGGGDGSILFRQGSGFERLKDPDPEATNGVFSLHEDGQGRLWVLSELDGLLLYSYRDGGLEVLPLPPALADVEIPIPVVVRRSFYEQADGTLWFASQGSGVYVLRQDGLEVLTTADGLNHDFVQTLAGDGEGSVWIATSGGLNRVRGGRIEDYNGILGLQGTPITSLLVDYAGSLWVGERALYRYSRRGAERIEPFDYFPDPVFFQDSEGSLWFGSVAGPLGRFRDGILEAIGTAEGLSADPVHSVYEDRAGDLWVGTYRGGLNRVSGDEITHYSQADGLPSGRVWSIEEASDREGRLWLGTGSGLVRFEDGSFEVFNKADGLSSDWIRVVQEDPNEPGTLWLGTIDAGLNRWRNGVVSRWTTEDGLTGNNIRWILTDRSGATWIGSENGVNLLRDGELTVVRVPKTRTRCALEDAEGTIWIGTAGGGLLRYAGGRFDTFTVKQGLPSNDVWAIEEDDQGLLWLGGPEGIVKLVKPPPASGDVTGISTLETAAFGSKDGLRSGLTAGGFPGSWKAADGRFWFTTLKGVVAVAADHEARLPIPAARVESIALDGGAAPAADSISVPAGTRQVAIRYTAPYLARPDRLGFRHRLVGFDDGWVDAADERVTQYTGLRPGDYRFEVAPYHLEDGRAGGAASVAFTVLPLWWQTGWFRGAILVVGLASIWGSMRLRARIAEARSQTLQEHRDELARMGRLAAMGELTAALSHELNQPLGAIRSNAEAATRFLSAAEPDLEEVGEILGDIIRDDQRATDVIERVRGMLKGSPFRPETLDIRPVIRNVLALVRTDAARRGVGIAVELDEGLPPVRGDRVQLEQVLLNLVLNGLDAVEASPRKRMTVSAGLVEDELVQVSVRDSGVGAGGQSLEALFDSLLTTKLEGMGMGLAISRRLVEAHGGTIWAEKNVDRGLTFFFTLPRAASAG